MKAGNRGRALELQRKLLALWNAITADNLPACTRHAQMLQGLPKTSAADLAARADVQAAE
ncbi:hypothetical protein NLM33_08550 [Bradyrhizobium sp. CCGUVB1N3]|uniref:hypothetical protein n=1 Tax=Bradyrhizobium sp. CCGUVB1N3 TaxID=2949629 RepID=UPI0020B20010|nr:hypothetical protein [Bradyrhizobium sp. CCGUVB1N3]MCP3470369.1 hypothetical protein [Bradyrhizobium sp. CCGUVB1N3]